MKNIYFSISNFEDNVPCINVSIFFLHFLGGTGQTGILVNWGQAKVNNRFLWARWAKKRPVGRLDFFLFPIFFSS